MLDEDDSVLAVKAARGDDRAYAVLVQRHKESLYRLLRRYTGEPDDAYEATHEAFIAAWGALKRYDPERPFAAWLRRIAINKARDLGRRTAVRRFFFGSGKFEDSGALDACDPAQPADETVSDQQDLTALDQAVRQLPDPLRAALLLTAFEERTQQEAADILGVSIKTVEMRVYRARKILAQTLDSSLRPRA